MKLFFLKSIILLALFFPSCKEKKLGLIDYLNYFKEPKNGLIESITIDTLEFSASIYSREYMALVGLGENTYTLSLADLDTAISSVEDFTYVLLEWDKKKTTSNNVNVSENEIGMLLHNDLPKQLFLETNNQLIPCVICNPELDYLGAKNRLWIGFAKNLQSLEGPLTLKINSQIISPKEFQIHFKNFSPNDLPSLNATNL